MCQPCDSAIPLVITYLRETLTHAYQNICTSMITALLLINAKPEMDVMSINSIMKNNLLYSYYGILYSNENILTTAIYVNIDESQKHNIKQNKEVRKITYNLFSLYKYHKQLKQKYIYYSHR